MKQSQLKFLSFTLACLLSFGIGFSTAYAEPPGNRVLNIGNWGEDVFWLQRKLMDLGLMDIATGQYGELTRAAVMELQKAHGLKVDGIAGPQTLGVLGKVESFTYYTVKAGDSLYVIAKRLDISMDELVQLNNLSSTNLTIGQRLKVPHQPQPLVYKVVPGDNLYNIAKAFGVTVSELAVLNNISDKAFIKPGQELIIPEPEDK